MTKSIEERYQKLSDIAHCLKRPSMWVGSTKPRVDEVYLPDEMGNMKLRSAVYIPAFLKIYDEIVSNSVDEHQRNPRLNKIFITVDVATGRITVRDNGGIPVQKHKEYDQWVPEMIFSSLKAGSNFDDTEERLVAGTNGVGSTLTNIFSREFVVNTADGAREFLQIYSNNMMERTEPEIKKNTGHGFTEISFVPDFSRFGMEQIDPDHMDMLRKRAIDAAACNPKLRVTFNNVHYQFSSFADYCRMYTQDVIYDESDRWKIGVAASSGEFQHVSFVNSVETTDGGTHVESIAQQIVESLRDRIKKKHKIELKPSELKNHLLLFVKADIVNPSFSSQTKEKLITEPRDFGSRHELTDKVMKRIFDTEVVQRILDWAQQKILAEERKALRALNKDADRGKVLKLIDAKSRVNRHLCDLSLFEGDSAVSAFRKFRDPATQGAFPLRGKFLNVTECEVSQVVNNQEVRDLLSAIGLRMGEPPMDLRYGRILFYTDADPDGDSIAGLLLNFFSRYWPELVEKGMLYRVMTPLVVCQKGDQRLAFYTNKDFRDWEDAAGRDIKKWSVEYKKGLASLENVDYQEIIKNPRCFQFAKGEDMTEALDDWFASDPTPRKEKILEKPEEEADVNE